MDDGVAKIDDMLELEMMLHVMQLHSFYKNGKIPNLISIPIRLKE